MIHLNTKERCLVNAETGEILRPSCIDDLISYHGYLKKTNEIAAQTLLKDAFKGEKVITNLIAFAQSQQ